MAGAENMPLLFPEEYHIPLQFEPLVIPDNEHTPSSSFQQEEVSVHPKLLNLLDEAMVLAISPIDGKPQNKNHSLSFAIPVAAIIHLCLKGYLTFHTRQTTILHRDQQVLRIVPGMPPTGDEQVDRVYEFIRDAEESGNNIDIKMWVMRLCDEGIPCKYMLKGAKKAVLSRLCENGVLKMKSQLMGKRYSFVDSTVQNAVYSRIRAVCCSPNDFPVSPHDLALVALYRVLDPKLELLFGKWERPAVVARLVELDKGSVVEALNTCLKYLNRVVLMCVLGTALGVAGVSAGIATGGVAAVGMGIALGTSGAFTGYAVAKGAEKQAEKAT